MTIGKKLYAGFGLILAILSVLFVVNIIAGFKERSARQKSVLAETKAKTEGNKSKEVARFLSEMLEGVGPSKARGRDTTMLREILDKTAERIGHELTNQPEVEVELRSTLADIYRELGLYQRQEEMARQNLQLIQTRFGEESEEEGVALDAPA